MKKIPIKAPPRIKRSSYVQLQELSEFKAKIFLTSLLLHSVSGVQCKCLLTAGEALACLAFAA